MAKINGTNLLIYADGTLIASQRTCTVSWEQDLPEASTKDSTGWEEHINGVRRCTCDFDALISTTGLNSVELIDYILNRANLVLLIDGGGFPIVGEATVKNISLTGAKEEAAGLTGSFKFTGPAWMLTGTFVNLMTDPDGVSTDYDTFTVSGIKVTSAINLAGAATAKSNVFAITNASTYKAVFFLTKTSGELPIVGLVETGVALRSDAVQTVEGVNICTMIANASSNCSFYIENSAAANFALTNIYLFKA